MRWRSFVGLVALATVGLLAMGMAASNQGGASVPSKEELATIRVQGTGEVSAPPDMLVVEIGVVTENKSVRVAQEQNRQQAAKVVAVLKAQGVENKDIQTSRYDILPLYDHSPSKEGAPPRLVGYRVENTLSVRVRHLDRAGAILDAVVGEGANRIGSLRFGLSQTAQLRQKALRLAVEEAVEKAKTIAAALGKEIVALQSIEESWDESPTPLRAMPAVMEFKDQAATPVEPGELVLRARVTAVFLVNPK